MSEMTHCANCGAEVPVNKPHGLDECMEPIDLTDFLLARIAEDEAVLRAASPGLDFNWGDYGVSPDLLVDAEFFNRFADRSRVLAECEAKRQIVAWASDGEGEFHWSTVLAPLALPYADHPDYREEWKP